MFMRWLTANFHKRSELRRNLIFCTCICMVALLAGCSLLPGEDQEEQLPTITPPKLAQKPVYEVTTDTLVSRVRGNGQLRSEQQEQLFFIDDNKRIKEIYVRSGDAVVAGQLLAELDVSDMERDLRQRKLRFRTEELAMIETLRRADELEPSQLEQAKIDFELKRSELVDLEAKIKQAKIFASFSGTVVSVNISKGDMVQAYKPVMTVADLGQLTVAATISRDDLRSVALGMEAVVNINAAGEFQGRVSQLPVIRDNQSPGGNNNPNPDTLDQYLLVDIDPFPSNASLGTPLSVVVITNKKENAIVIPVAALRTHVGRNYVQVEESDGSRREVDVEIGQQTPTVIEIIKGLSPGQKVVGR